MKVNHRRVIFGAVLTSVALMGFAGGVQGALILTGVLDGPLTGGTPKAVELYASTDIADLAQYGLGSANNGGGTDGVELILSGSANAGDFLYVATEIPQFNAWFGFNPDFTNGNASNVNGDDAIELFFDATGAFAGGETVVDVFGDINMSGTGQPWEYLDGWAYRNNGTGPDGSTFVLANWSFSGINALDGATSNATAATPFPTASYIPEPGAILLALCGLCGSLFVARRDR